MPAEDCYWIMDGARRAKEDVPSPPALETAAASWGTPTLRRGIEVSGGCAKCDPEDAPLHATLYHRPGNTLSFHPRIPDYLWYSHPDPQKLCEFRLERHIYLAVLVVFVVVGVRSQRSIFIACTA